MAEALKTRSESFQASLYDLWGSVRAVLLLTVAVGAGEMLTRSAEIEAWLSVTLDFLPSWVAEVGVAALLYLVLELLRRTIKNNTK